MKMQHFMLAQPQLEKFFFFFTRSLSIIRENQLEAGATTAAYSNDPEEC